MEGKVYIIKDSNGKEKKEVSVKGAPEKETNQNAVNVVVKPKTVTKKKDHKVVNPTPVVKDKADPKVLNPTPVVKEKTEPKVVKHTPVVKKKTYPKEPKKNPANVAVKAKTVTNMVEPTSKTDTKDVIVTASVKDRHDATVGGNLPKCDEITKINHPVNKEKESTDRKSVV